MTYASILKTHPLLYISMDSDGRMSKMAEKLHKDQDVWNAMLSDDFGTAMNELATNPQVEYITPLCYVCKIHVE